MSLINALEDASLTIASVTGYPKPLRVFISAAPFDTSYKISDDSSIARSAHVRGNINMDTGAIIAPQSDVSGRLKMCRHARIGRNCNIRGNLKLGEWSNFTKNIDVFGDVDIGGYGAFARRISFQENNHDMSKPGMQIRFYSNAICRSLDTVSKGPIKIGNDVWIGSDVNVLSGVTIGNGAVVGAGAVVTKNVEPYEIVAGVPAKHRGWRFDEETRTKLCDISWWEWDEERIKRNTEFFTTDLREHNDIHTLID